MPIAAPKSGLQAKVGWVLENSGNFQSNEHKNIPTLRKNGWENGGQSCLPPSEKLHFQATHSRFSSFACATIKSYKILTINLYSKPDYLIFYYIEQMEIMIQAFMD